MGTQGAPSAGSITQWHASVIAEQAGLGDLDGAAALAGFEARVPRNVETKTGAQFQPRRCGRGTRRGPTRPWNRRDPAPDGTTSVANLGPLRHRHHQMKTSGGWTWSLEPTTGAITSDQPGLTDPRQMPRDDTPGLSVIQGRR